MSVRVENLAVDLGTFHLQNINLTLKEGDFFALMGPTGAGKSVLLEALVGLVPLISGEIFIDERKITNLAPEKRGISIVYQDYALFPHLTVLDNIRYGLRFNPFKRGEVAVDELISLLELGHLLKRYPATLSGGEQQRVALARALAVSPDILLLDEPLSALDPNFRQDLRAHLKTLHQASGATFLMVTHDFSEALSLAQRAAVMNQGVLEQVGAIEEIFCRPTTTMVADFVGMKNLFKVKFSGSTAQAAGLEIKVGKESRAQGYIAIRPEDLILSKEPLISSVQNSFAGSVVAIRSHGFFYEIDVAVNSLIFTAVITNHAFFDLEPTVGDGFFVSFKATAVHLL
ncbi:MAG: ABC transporter ATP-binding protein [Deltaproteobacteria bacterium]|nr:ABC transporter ATP-binding protein [Candidatus Tharpella sp.]